MKLVSKVKNVKTPKSQIGMGDFYGQGVKNKTGKMRSSTMDYSSPTPKQLKKPPKSLA